MTPKRKTSGESVRIPLLRPFISVVVLTAFLLGISLLVKGLADINTGELTGYAFKLLDKLPFDFNIDKRKVGEVAGGMIARVTNTNLGGGDSTVRVLPEQPTSLPGSALLKKVGIPVKEKSGEASLIIGLLADAHSDYANLDKALKRLSEQKVKDFFYLGDLTELGVLEDLVEGKKHLDASKLDYEILAGDHDLWKSVGYDNYLSVFKIKNSTVTLEGIKFVLLDNSPNYTAISDVDMQWFEAQVSDAAFVVMSQPLVASALDRYMGKVNGEEIADLLKQRDLLLDMIRNSSVKAVIAADLHTSGQVTDLVKPELKHFTVGALTSERNLQSPRYSLFSYFKDGTYELKDVVLE